MRWGDAEYKGKQPLTPFLESCNEFLEGHSDSEKVKYLISRCTGQSQEHLRNQRDFNRQASKDFTYEDAKEALKGASRVKSLPACLLRSR